MKQLCLALFCALAPAAAMASQPDCEALAQRAGADQGVPQNLLPAIARTESGASLNGQLHRAWPWTLNVQGKGAYFQTKEAALARLKEVVAQGITNVDVGCMQINYRWHGDGFDSLADMLDPEQNTAYAADYMSRLRKESGSWERATRYYHSREADRGKAYERKVLATVAKLDDDPPAAAPASSAPAPEAAKATREVQPVNATNLAKSDRRFQSKDALIRVRPDGSHSGKVTLPQGRVPDRALLLSYSARGMAKVIPRKIEENQRLTRIKEGLAQLAMP